MRNKLQPKKAPKPTGKSTPTDQQVASLQPQLFGISTPWADAIACGAIFALALGARLVYLFQIEGSPIFYDPVGDGRVYGEWAKKIAAGSILGEGVFYQAPLYPYFLGFLRFVLGPDLWSVRVVQIVLGAASCSLVFLAGQAFFGRAAGIAAGILLSLYAPAIFYEALIQKAVLDLFLMALLLLLLGRLQARHRLGKFFASGLLLGVLALSRENALAWILAVPAWVWFYFRAEHRGVRLKWALALVLGAFLALLPVGVRNLKVGGEFALTTSQLGPNFFIGNNPGADGTYIPLRGGHGDARFEQRDATEIAEQAVGRSLSPRQVSRYWMARSFDYILTQPADWLGLMARKWLLVWNVFEIEDSDDFYLCQTWSSFLGALGRFAHFGLLAPLAAAGSMLTWRRWRRLSILYLLLGSFAASVALIFVLGRYRLPLVPILALFAGAAIVEWSRLWRERRSRDAIASVALALGAAAIVFWPMVGPPGPSAAGYNNVGNALARQGRIQAAAESYRQALALDPASVAAHYNLGNLSAQQRDLKAAAHHYREAIRLSPDFPEAYTNLGVVLAQQGNLQKGIELLRKAVSMSPGRAESHFYLGTALGMQSEFIEAAEHLRRAIAIKPDYAEAYRQLGTLLAAQGHLQRAIELFERALHYQPGLAEAHESLALAYSQLGNKDKAAAHYREARRLIESRRPESRTGR